MAELQRVGLFAALPGGVVARLAEGTERVELASGSDFGSTTSTIDVVLSGLARGSGGLLRPGDVAAGAATAVTACVVARMPREALAAVAGEPL